MSDSAQDHTHDHSKVYVNVLIALAVLTLITVGASRIHLGRVGNIGLGLAIATVKASLVVMFFMHLLYDKPLNAFAFISSLLFVSLFIGLTLADAVNYQPELSAKEADTASP